MSKFSEQVNEKTPRLAVLYKQVKGGDDTFQWGVVGQIPILSLIGAVTQAQANLYLIKEDSPCDQVAFVIAWDEAAKRTTAFCHADVPDESLIGMLETIKAVLVASRMAQKASRDLILGPDGNPARR